MIVINDEKEGDLALNRHSAFIVFRRLLWNN